MPKGPRRDRDTEHSSISSARFADIQLLSSSGQVLLAQEFANQFAAGGGASVDELLATLRQDLRTELSLEAVPRNVEYLVIERPPPPPDT